MKRTVLGCAAIAALLGLVLTPGPAGAWHRPVRSRVFISAGPHWWAPYPYWWYGGPPTYYIYVPPAVVVQEPPVYIQQAPVPLPPAPPPPSQGYWYYCPSARAYYPNVQTCPEEWMKVPPR